MKNAGGELKLLNLTKKVHDLLQITKLYTVFDVKDDETTAVGSFTAVDRFVSGKAVATAAAFALQTMYSSSASTRPRPMFRSAARLCALVLMGACGSLLAQPAPPATQAAKGSA